MEKFLEIAKGPLFRLCFAIMVLGLTRILVTDLWAALKAYKKAGDKNMQWKLILKRSWEWFFPFRKVARNFHIYSVFSILFHIGIIIVPLFLYAHIRLWYKSVGISWPALPYLWSFWLTVGTMVFTVALFIGRMTNKQAKAVSRKQDYLWLLLLFIPFISGFVCANLNVSPSVYSFFILVHVIAGDLIFLLMPFSKIAHCVLMPFSQLICGLAWKFPADTDDDICTTLNKKGAPV